MTESGPRTLVRLVLMMLLVATGPSAVAQQQVSRDRRFQQYGLFAKTAPRAAATSPVITRLPLKLKRGDRVALVGNSLFDRAQHFGYLEALLHQQDPRRQLVVRNLCLIHI